MSEPPRDPGDPRDVVVVLTEEPLEGPDAARLVALHEGEDLEYWVLVPADTHRDVLAEVLDRLSLFQLREALDAARSGQPDPDGARREAAEVLAATTAGLRALGRPADGQVTDDDPLPALEAAVAARGAREAVVVTRPRAVEEVLHRDWATRAREALGVPVLHTYGGTGALGSGTG